MTGGNNLTDTMALIKMKKESPEKYGQFLKDAKDIGKDLMKVAVELQMEIEKEIEKKL